jgi:hypothetical protein
MRRDPARRMIRYGSRLLVAGLLGLPVVPGAAAGDVVGVVKLAVLNSDGILHNFHTLSRLNPSRNLAQPKFARPLRVTFEQPEVVQVKCDLHGEGFMRAWIVVASHPYYALTDEEGQFRLPDVPRGPHILEVWHEALGTRRLPVTAGESGEVAATVTFAIAEGGSVK